MSFAARWMNVEVGILNKVSQKSIAKGLLYEEKYCMTLLICGI